MRMLPGLALVAALPFAAAPALAADPWVLDKSHAHVTFTADHLGFSMVHGQFRSFDADILFDPENIEATELTVTIDAASVDTFWEARDRHIRDADFLNVSTYPEITFVSREVRQTGENTAEIIGDLTLIGETREVIFEATLNKIGPSPFNPDRWPSSSRSNSVCQNPNSVWSLVYSGVSSATCSSITVSRSRNGAVASSVAVFNSACWLAFNPGIAESASSLFCRMKLA